MSDEPINKLKLDGFINDRSFIHSVRFVNGYSAGWRFCLREEFREALDIRRANWVGLEGSDNPLVQGTNFAFAAGHTIYDCREAYCCAWGVALKTLRYAVQIVSATPAAVVVTKEYLTNGEVFVSEDGKTMKDKYQVEYRRKKLTWGSVNFILLKKKPDGSGLFEIGRYQTDQEKFAAFLQTGVIRDSLGKVLSTECADLADEVMRLPSATIESVPQTLV